MAACGRCPTSADAKAMQARGGKLVVIDPRRTETAELADQHLFIRPGGDAFLLLGIVHTLFADRRGRLRPPGPPPRGGGGAAGGGAAPFPPRGGARRGGGA